MRTPIACALAWPDRIAWPAPKLDLAALGRLTFEAPDLTRFPALDLARQALKAGGATPAVFNAANEVAVAAFLAGQIPFLAIPRLVEHALGAVKNFEPSDLSAVLAVDADARRVASAQLSRLAL